MLTIIVPGTEYWDESTEKFVILDSYKLDLEHSLVSISKWESIFEKPFLSDKEKTHEEVVAYIQAMNLTPEIPPELFGRLTPENYAEINAYIEAKMTATWFSDSTPAAKPREVITAELIYYYMITFNIPTEFENWHLNRLFTLIKICSVKNSPPKKMSRKEIMERNRTLNEQRRHQLGTKG